MPVSILPAERIRRLPPYLFAEIDRMKKEVAARGVDLISLGIGDPDSPTFPHIVAALQEAATRPANHRYPDYEGMPSFRAAAASYLEKRFDVRCDPATEIVSLIGSKEGIANMAVAFVDPGDIVLVPDPGYPVYSIGTTFNGGTVLPDAAARRERLPARPRRHPRRGRASARSSCGSSTPTTRPARSRPRSSSTNVVAFAEEDDIIVAHDIAYAEMYFDDAAAELPRDAGRARGRHRVPLAVEDLQHDRLAHRLRVRQPRADRGTRQSEDQRRLRHLPGGPGGRHRRAHRRPDAASRRCATSIASAATSVLAALASLGLRVRSRCEARSTCWVKVPRGFTATSLVAKLLQDTAWSRHRRSGFGAAGEGYIRFSLTVATPRLAEAVERLKTLKL